MAENKSGRPLHVSPPRSSQDSDQQDGEDLSREPAGPTIRFQHHHHHEQQQQQHSPRNIISSILTPHQFISTPLYLSTNSPQFDPVVLGVKRPRFNPNLTGQWKPVPSPSPSPTPSFHQNQTQALIAAASSDQSSPSPTIYNPKAQPLRQNLPIPVQSQPQLEPSIAPIASSSDTTASPSPSSLPTATASTQDPLGPTSTTGKAEIGEQLALPPPPPPQQQQHQQFRKGKYVSPVWKPHEMLWLAKAWRSQYQGNYGSSGLNVGPSSQVIISSSDMAGGVAAGGGGRGKTRADKDKEVAEFLKRHGVNRDAKTAGTKWDNMLGEFRKVYEWERGGEREKLMVGKSYFRLSPYERKIHRLPASFDEEVFEELAQFMGSRIRSSSSTISSSSSYGKGGGGGGGESESSSGDDLTRSALPGLTALPPPPPSFTDQDHTSLSGRTGQQTIMAAGDHHQPYLPRRVSRINFLGFDQQSQFQTGFPSPTTPSPSSSSLSSRDQLRRIGRMRMIWEESVSLWADPLDSEHNRGRVKVQASNFLSADELTFLDDAMVACTMEAYEDGPLKGFSVDRFLPGQQIKVFGRRKSSVSSTAPSSSGIRSMEFSDPTDYYMGCLRRSPPTLPTSYELPWHIQEPPAEDLRFPLQKTLYRDLPQGKELFFTASPIDNLDSRSFTIDILSSLIRQTPHLTSSTCRDSFITLWDDCINRIISKFCPLDLTLVRKPPQLALSSEVESQWPNITGFVSNLCLWRGEETDRVRDGQLHPSSILEKLLWSFSDVPYILGYYAVGARVTFCAFSRSPHHHHKDGNNNILRSDLLTVDLSLQSERIKTIVPCWRIACLLPLLAEKFLTATTKRAMSSSSVMISKTYSDFERVDLGNGNLIEMTPYTVTRFYTSQREWIAVKEVYEILDGRVPHSEHISSYSEEDLSISFKPRGVKAKPQDVDELMEALKHVTKALVALHDLCFMHRDLSWDKVVRRCCVVDAAAGEGEWILCGFEEAVAAPQIKPNSSKAADVASGKVEQWGGHRAPEMGRGGGVYGVKVDIWGVGYLVKTSGLGLSLPKQLKELEKRCLVESPEQRPTAADCYHHLLQFQASGTTAAGSAVASGEEDGY